MLTGGYAKGCLSTIHMQCYFQKKKIKYRLHTEGEVAR